MKIKEIRKEKKLTQQQLADILGVTQATLSGWESEKFEPDLKSLSSIADFFGVSTDYLLGRAEKEANSHLTTSPELKTGSLVAEPSDEKTVTFHIFDNFKPDFEKLSFSGLAGDSVEIPLSLLDGRPKTDFFCLRMQGDSMFPEYQKNDILFVEACENTDYSGQVGIACCGGDPAVVKKIEYDSKRSWVKLVSINPSYLPIKVENADLAQFRILGIPKLLIRKFNS